MITEEIASDLEVEANGIAPAIDYDNRKCLKEEDNKIPVDTPYLSLSGNSHQTKRVNGTSCPTPPTQIQQELPSYRGNSFSNEIYMVSGNSESTESVTFGTMKHWLKTNLDLDLEVQSAEEIAATLWSSSIGPERISAILTQKKRKLEQALGFYISRYNFSGLSLDKALRHLSATFILAGESQQVERVLHAFATEYYRQNTTVFESVDLVFLLANAIVILNTDLYNPNNKYKMTKREFVNNVEKAIQAQYHGGSIKDSVQSRGENTAMKGLAFPIPLSMLKNMYKSVRDQQIRMPISAPSNLLNLNRTTSIQSPAPSLSICSSTSSYLWSTSSLLGSPAESVDRNSSLSTQSNQLPSSLLSVDNNSSDSPPLKIIHQGLLARKRLFDKTNKRSRDRSWHQFYIILDNSELYFFKPFLMHSVMTEFENNETRQGFCPDQHLKQKDALKPLSLKKSNIKDLGNVDCIILRHAVAKAYSEGTVMERYSSTGKGKPMDITTSSVHYLWILLIPGGCQILFRATTDASRLEWIQAVNQAAAFQSTPPLPCPIGSDYRLLYIIPNLSLSRSYLPLSSQIALLERKIKEIEDSISKLVSTSLASSTSSQTTRELTDHSFNTFSFSIEKKGKPCLQSKMNFLNWELQKYHIYVSALKLDKPHFLTLPPSYLGQRDHLYTDK